jgi:hypothetical protein
MEQFEQTVCDKYMELRKRYGALNQAVKHAKANGVEGEPLARLTTEKKSVNADLSALESTMLTAMAQSTNMRKVGEGWYVIRFLDNKNKFCITAEPLLEDGVDILIRGRFDKELTRKSLDDLIPSILNEEALNKHKTEVAVLAEQYLAELTPLDIVLVVPEGGAGAVRPSSHSLKRRAERKFGIDTRHSEEYVKANRAMLHEDVMAEYGTAEHLWTDNIGIEFWFGVDNTMFIVGENETTVNCKAIVTLYEENFGFSKEINRNIVYQQIEVIKAKQKEYKEAVAEHMAEEQVMKHERSVVTSEMDVLSAKMNELTAKLNEISAKEQSADKHLEVKRKEFDCEYNKLFKKWEL